MSAASISTVEARAGRAADRAADYIGLHASGAEREQRRPTAPRRGRERDVTVTEVFER